jgi:hypothetical protein
MPNIPRFYIAGFILVLVLGAITSGLWLYPAWLPDPATATRPQLLRWLVLRDLAQESQQTRQTLAVRLEAEYGDFEDFGGAFAQLDNSQQNRVFGNLRLMVAPWLASKVHEFDRTPISSREAYIDRFIDRIERWKSALAKVSLPLEQGKPVNATEVFMQGARDCRERAATSDQAKVDAFVAAVEKRWFARQFQGLKLWGK